MPRSTPHHPPILRRELLRHALPATVKLIQANQTAQTLSGVIEDYLALQWLERGEHGLRLTDIGRAICLQTQRSLASRQSGQGAREPSQVRG